MMTYQEKQDRQIRIEKALAMFPDERNISIAIKLYGEATGDIISRLNTREHGGKIPSVMDDYERIPCEKCGADILFRILPENDEGYQTRLECSNKKCDYAINSEYSIVEWMQVLKKKGEEDEI